MSRHMNMVTNAVGILLLLTAILSLLPLDEYGQQPFADFRFLAGAICVVGIGICLQRLFNRIRRRRPYDHT